MLRLDWIIAGVIAGTLLAPAWAGTPINETRPLNADGRISVNNLAGEIEISAWDRKEVSITGQLSEDIEKFEITGDASDLSVYVRYPRKSGRGVEETILQLRVPTGAAVKLEGVSADLRVNGISGELQANSVSGDIEVSAPARTVKLQTVSGDIDLRGAASSAELQSVSGDLQANGVSGTLSAETVSGDVGVVGGTFTSLTAESVSGDIVLAATMGSDADLRAESMSGDIIVRLDRQPDASVSLKTFSGSLGGEYGPDHRGELRKFQTVLGSGKGRISLNSFSGDIHLGKR